MGKNGNPPAADDGYGVLVGWSHHGFNGRLDLCLQRVSSLEDAERDDVQAQHFYMTDNQALLLAHYLLGVVGKKPAARRKSWLRRMLPG